MTSKTLLPIKDFSKTEKICQIPNLLEVQLNSYKMFLQQDIIPSKRKRIGLQRIFLQVFPITIPAKNFSLEFVQYSIGVSKYSEIEAQERGVSYAAPLTVKLRLVVYESKPEQEEEPKPGETEIEEEDETTLSQRKVLNISESDIYFGDLPLMTDRGTFIINGAERVIVNQLHRAPGIFFDKEEHPSGKKLYTAKIIPYRGSWLEFSTDINDVIYVNIDKKRKIPVTVLLKSAGYSTKLEIFREFFETKRIKLDEYSNEQLYKMAVADDIVLEKEFKQEEEEIPEETKNTGKKSTKKKTTRRRKEIKPKIIRAGETLNKASYDLLVQYDIKEIEVVNPEDFDEGQEIALRFICNTLLKDDTETREEALFKIYNMQRPGYPSDINYAARLFSHLFFNPKRYDLGEIGRYKLNRKLLSGVPLEVQTLTKEDFIGVVRKFLYLEYSKEQMDDIDHLSNRRVRSVGELLEEQFNLALERMVRNIKDKISLKDLEMITPYDLTNTRIVSSTINSFFGASQLSQYMDQVNPLSELTNKRRLSALGVGGLTRERAGFEVRDVHFTHYGRICPIETPEGPNVGLITSLSTFARVNRYGFIETPYRLVIGGQIKDVMLTAEWDCEVIDIYEEAEPSKVKINKTVHEISVECITLKNLKTGKLKTYNLGTFSDKIAKLASSFQIPINLRPIISVGQRIKANQPLAIIYLSAEDEAHFNIAPFGTKLKSGKLEELKIIVRRKGDQAVVDRNEVDFIDIDGNQVVSAAASLIPFLEHDDANRALMGSNMQRQAVPLLMTEAPAVGTGLEQKVAEDSGMLIIAKHDGVVTKVTADTIVLESIDDNGHSFAETYRLKKFLRSNQDTSINQRPVVIEGDEVKKGTPLADGPASDHGVLALGKNVLAAFMSWYGYNYEDAIIISRRMVKNEAFTSVHIVEFELQVRDTKMGVEEITREIPNVSEEAVKNLDEEGIIYIGTEVEPDDILVGKVTPKGERELSPEEKLLRAIFRGKGDEVKDASLRVPPGVSGVVVDVKLFSRHVHDAKNKKIIRDKKEKIQEQYAEIRANIIFSKNKKLHELMLNQKSHEVYYMDSRIPIIPPGRIITRDDLKSVSIEKLDIDRNIVADEETNERIYRLYATTKETLDSLDKEQRTEEEKLQRRDTLPPGVVKLVKVYVAKKRQLSIGDKMAGRHGNKGVVSIIVPEEDMPFLEDGTPIDIILNPLGVPSRMNVGQILETTLGWAAHNLGYRAITPVFNGATVDDIKKEITKSNKRDLRYKGNGIAPYPDVDMPEEGRLVLYDGKTGKQIEQNVSVGIIYMMKLSHLADDKVHARSTGPYSLVTQQPLGGKGQFGGQRFGEMEVWAMEAYGAAFTLQELLTVKSDDMEGRTHIFQAIVKGENPDPPGMPESFNVLLKELQSLAIDIQLIKKDQLVLSGKHATVLTPYDSKEVL
ncbi:MAG: DNA-directed RNA polymerase subunit beta [Candidatus Coatesbacteria bacterium]|nr:DNA-directed RNA polymerase subunit beta [Candidatus Coatesbacteria bacterium]